MLKKLLTIVLGASVFYSFSQNGLLPNPGFENWTSTVLYENPVSWGSSNTNEFRGTALTKKSTDAQHGSLSVLLESAVIDDDTLFGYVYLGKIGNEGPSGGPAYTSDFDRVVGYYKSDIALNDTALMLLIKYTAGVEDMDFGIFTGAASTWTPFSFDVTAGAADSIFVGFVNSHPFSDDVITNPSSWLMVDNVSFVNTSGGTPAVLPNYSFETWEDISSEDPTDWHTLNPLLVGMGLVPVTKTTDAYAGTYAALLSTLLVNNEDTIPGIISLEAINWQNLGSPNMEDVFSKFPYTAEPTSASFYYKYIASGADEGSVHLEFFQGGSSIGLHAGQLQPAATYQLFSTTVSLAQAPDSVLLVFSSGENPGSVLYLDQLALSGGTVGLQNLMNKIGFSAYPNPTSEVLFIRIEESVDTRALFEVIDINGRLLHRDNVNFTSGSVFEYSVNHLQAGIYFYRLTGDEFSTSEKFVVK